MQPGRDLRQRPVVPRGVPGAETRAVRVARCRARGPGRTALLALRVRCRRAPVHRRERPGLDGAGRAADPLAGAGRAPARRGGTGLGSVAGGRVQLGGEHGAAGPVRDRGRGGARCVRRRRGRPGRRGARWARGPARGRDRRRTHVGARREAPPAAGRLDGPRAQPLARTRPRPGRTHVGRTRRPRGAAWLARRGGHRDLGDRRRGRPPHRGVGARRDRREGAAAVRARPRGPAGRRTRRRPPARRHPRRHRRPPRDGLAFEPPRPRPTSSAPTRSSWTRSGGSRSVVAPNVSARSSARSANAATRPSMPSSNASAPSSRISSPRSARP